MVLGMKTDLSRTTVSKTKAPTSTTGGRPNTVGILGDGQLSRMLVQQGQRLGLNPWVLGSSPDSPAGQVTGAFLQGNIQNSKDIRRLFRMSSLIAFESEFVAKTALIEARRGLRTQIFPSPVLMDKLADRWSQKKLLVAADLPVAPFALLGASGELDLQQELQRLSQTLKRPLVIKQRKFGYDGYGTFYWPNTKKTQTAFSHALGPAFIKNPGYIVEPLVQFRREMAVMVARSRNGECIAYPLVEWGSHQSKCLWVKGPTDHPAWKPTKLKIFSFLSQIKYVGVMAFEFFDTGKNLLVNEIAPRVHNSGHYTLEACQIDQFTMHWLCLLGAKLPQPRLTAPDFAMVNLLSRGNAPVRWQWPTVGQLHWYGKTQSRPGRKMGHLTVLGTDSAGGALKKARESLKKIKGVIV